MSEDAKRKAIKKYFKPFPKWSIWLILLGIVVLLIGTQTSGGVAVAGIVILAIGALVIYTSVGGKPSDSQMDQYLEEDLQKVAQKMLEKLGLDESEMVAESVFIHGPGWKKLGVERHAKLGADRKPRYTPIQCTVIGFCENQLVYYNCLLDFTTGGFLDVSTDEYFYRDVVSASTQSVSMSIPIAKGKVVQLDSSEEFTLTTSGGTTVSNSLETLGLLNEMGLKDANMQLANFDRGIQVIRRMLRDKKA